MVSSRLNRYQEQKLQKRLFLTIAGSIALIAFFVFFGLQILINFSVFVDTIRGTPKDQPKETPILLPPRLDPLPEATNSGTLTITGNGQPGMIAIIYVNDSEENRTTIATTGAIKVSDIKLVDGHNAISAKITDDKGNMSNLSNVITTTISKKLPKLEVNEPKPDTLITNEEGVVNLTGKTEESNTITINGRVVVIKADGSFSANISLAEGENTLITIATNQAGNQAKDERKVTYRK